MVGGEREVLQRILFDDRGRVSPDWAIRRLLIVRRAGARVSSNGLELEVVAALLFKC